MRKSCVIYPPVFLCSHTLTAVLLAITMLFFGSGIVFAQEEEALEKRLEALEKKLEQSIASGKGVPPELIKEIQEVTALLLRMEAEDEAEADSPFVDEEGENWISFPFTGTLTVHRVVNWNSSFDEMQINKRDVATMTINVTGTREVKKGGITVRYPVGTVTTRIEGHDEVRFDDGESGKRISYQMDDTKHFDGSEEEECPIWLEVNEDEGVYRLDVSPATVEGEAPWVQWLPDNREFTGTDSITADVNAWFEEECGRIERGSYDPKSKSIADECDVTVRQIWTDRGIANDAPGAVWRPEEMLGIMASSPEDQAKIYPIQYHVTWSFGEQPLKVKAVLETDEEYQKWMPDLEKEEGENLVTVRARITEPEGIEGHFHWELQAVSKKPGECMNHPEDPFSARVSKDPDLEIYEWLSDPDLEVFDDKQKAKTSLKVRESKIRVQAKDWGGYGKATVTVRVKIGGREQEVEAIHEATGLAYVTLPRDENENFIPDEWERINEIQGGAPTDDNDQKPRSATQGDGLTLYEEYRGFHVQGEHQRLDPKTKDLFVYDVDGFVQKSHLEKAVSPLKVWYITEAEMNAQDIHASDYRVVNRNQKDFHLVVQHGLVVKRDTTGPGDRVNWGRAQGTTVGPPKTADPWVSIYVDNIRQSIMKKYFDNKKFIDEHLKEKGITPGPEWMDQHIEEAIKYVTTHECGHGIGILHHYKTLPKGATLDNFNPSMGWIMCTMRYLADCGNFPDYQLKIEHHDDVVDIMAGLWPWPNTYCTSMDNCKAQILVSDNQ